MSTKDKVEIVNDGNLFTTRIQVPGGWVYHSYDKSHNMMGMCFVPAPAHYENKTCPECKELFIGNSMFCSDHCFFENKTREDN